MGRDVRDSDKPNWWVIILLVSLGIGMIATAYYMSSYWQGIFVNVGTALFLSAAAVFFEPRLMRQLRQPRTLDEALARFSLFTGPPPQGPADDSAQIKDHVLRLVGRTGLHQEPPEPSLARFVDFSGSSDVTWCVRWDKTGLVHSVTVHGKSIPLDLCSSIGWNRKITAHEDRIYKILCYLLRQFERSTRSWPDSKATAPSQGKGL
jgi:hypothetical protein